MDIVEALPLIRINSNAEIRRQPITADEACVIVDNFLQNPDEIVEFACRHAGEFSMPERGYPGLLLDIKDDAMTEVYRFIRFEMSKLFAFLKGGMKLSANLSMATMQPHQLSNLQRICHVDPRDRMDRFNYAALVYLFKNEELGGTGFYRWKDRKLMEQATAAELDDPAKGLAFLQEHFATFREPACYMTESNEIAELVASVPARFNRLIFYSGDLPHSASIASPELLAMDFSQGRLTLNCFANIRRR